MKLVNPKKGDTLECAIWLDGRESPRDVERWRADAPAILLELGGEQTLSIGPVRYEIKRPGDDRVPPVPKNISGPDVRLLVAEADVMDIKPKLIRASSFVQDLDKRDLKRLRDITRQAHRKHNPRALPLTDAEVDEIIEAIGPESAAKSLKAAVDGASIH